MWGFGRFMSPGLFESRIRPCLQVLSELCPLPGCVASHLACHSVPLYLAVPAHIRPIYLGCTLARRHGHGLEHPLLQQAAATLRTSPADSVAVSDSAPFLDYRQAAPMKMRMIPRRCWLQVVAEVV